MGSTTSNSSQTGRRITTAARDLRTRLVSVLKSEAKAATERIRAGSSTDRRTDERAAWGPELAALLDDPELWSCHFYGDEASPTGVVALLAEHVTREGSANRRHQFESGDFEGLTSRVKPEGLSPGARSPIKRLTDKKYRQLAAEVLNSALDEATQNLLDLGGTPLSEVFLELRRALLEENCTREFRSTEEAHSAGYRGCEICKPSGRLDSHSKPWIRHKTSFNRKPRIRGLS